MPGQHECEKRTGCLSLISPVQVKYNEFAGGSNQSILAKDVSGRGRGGCISFNASLNSHAMGSAASAKEMGGPITAFQYSGDAHALSYATLEPSDGGGQAIVVKTSLS